ncbi:polysaccharide deacetylase family protein [Desulfuromonas sp. KJ2020]|uniref:polysaccharide deacetylase family protein n=1 Tax=Desulfuromonas sp. KJ2020 TaxID=2919173 RepID=UPI0020A7A996|nr:polysaccharide deacetylase family protein [Desulfuromonas sp. KJ2020]MCP3178141.1 polysaccharide deacetylase family protein [Desulfuromonas sp. KJ2020]
MKLFITIDTEEDNWANYSRTDNPVENIRKIVELQALFDRYGARPTYLVSYPVATNPESVSILRRILEQRKCEIGAHCHPWNTPPFEEELNDFNTMLCNLPEPLILKKLTTLHEAIVKNFGVTPVSFRAGRWGFSSGVARSLAKLNYRVDTSVSPYIDWSEYDGPDFSNFSPAPYRFDPDDIGTPNPGGALMQMPATVAFLQRDFESCRQFSKTLETSLGKKLRLKGIYHCLGLLNKAWFSPEVSDHKTLIKLVYRMKMEGFPCMNMSFHSTTLKIGLSPFVKNKYEERKFYFKIEKLLSYINNKNIEIVLLKNIGKSIF